MSIDAREARVRRVNHRPVDSSQSQAALEVWAAHLIRTHIEKAGEALAAYCERPRSAKRLHSARKQLARLRCALDDLSGLAGVTPDFRERVLELHKRAGKVRDADVLDARVREYCEDAFGHERSQLRGMDAVLCKRRKKARRKLQTVIARTLSELHT